LEIGIWLGCLVAVIMGINQVMKFIDHFREKPPAHQTYQVKGDYVTQRELEQLREALNDLAAETRESFESVRREMKHDAETRQAASLEQANNMQAQVNDLIKAIGELRGFITKKLHL